MQFNVGGFTEQKGEEIMITNEEVRKAIEKYQKEHPLHSAMLDVTSISSKEGVDVLNNVIEQVSKKVDEDTELWAICEMAKMYMQGVRPVYPVKQEGKWIKITKDGITPAEYTCSNCGRTVKSYYDDYFVVKEYPFCHCGADMRGNQE